MLSIRCGKRVFQAGRDGGQVTVSDFGAATRPVFRNLFSKEPVVGNQLGNIRLQCCHFSCVISYCIKSQCVIFCFPVFRSRFFDIGQIFINSNRWSFIYNKGVIPLSGLSGSIPLRIDSWKFRSRLSRNSCRIGQGIQHIMDIVSSLCVSPFFCRPLIPVPVFDKIPIFIFIISNADIMIGRYRTTFQILFNHILNHFIIIPVIRTINIGFIAVSGINQTGYG